MKKFGWLSLVGAMMVALVLLAGCGKASQPAAPEKQQAGKVEAQEVVLKAVTAWPEKIRDNDGFRFLTEEVTARGQGKVKIQYLGGPEVVPTMELINAVKNGSVDVAWLSMGYTVSNVPEANAMKLSKFTPEEERQNGLYDLYNEIFQKKANAVYLGKGIPGVHFQLYTNFPVKTLADFQGKPIRVTPSYKDFVQALGASPVTIDPGEVYTALERGVVAGYGWPSFGVGDWGWDAKTKYIIEPGFYQVDTVALVNKNKWDSLSGEAKQVLTDAAKAVEKRAQEHFAEIVRKDREQLLQKGLQVITLPAAEADKYVQTADEAVMRQVLQASPEYGPKLQAILFK